MPQQDPYEKIADLTQQLRVAKEQLDEVERARRTEASATADLEECQRELTRTRQSRAEAIQKARGAEVALEKAKSDLQTAESEIERLRIEVNRLARDLTYARNFGSVAGDEAREAKDALAEAQVEAGRRHRIAQAAYRELAKIV